MWISLILLGIGMIGHFMGSGPVWWRTYSHAKSWWSVALGIVAVGVIGRMPKDLVIGILGRGGSFRGILRATVAGVALDLCNHGILMVAAQLYKKGASLGQTVAFLIASPWNSLSLTLILAALIGWKWMLIFIVISMLIGVITGWVMDGMVKRGQLPANPHANELPENFRLMPEIRKAMPLLAPNPTNLKAMLHSGLAESRMVLRWIFVGVVMAAAVRAFVPDNVFTHFFGPSLLGLVLTLVATTVIEVCSEGSSPIAADLMNRAMAPGNSFTFLMAGAATDYTEIMVLRDLTKSWKAALCVPLITVPQVLVIGWLMNR
jgi:uncharacterized protein